MNSEHRLVFKIFTTRRCARASACRCSGVLVRPGWGGGVGGGGGWGGEVADS